MLPKGKLLIIGGAEDKEGEPPHDRMVAFNPFEILKELLTNEEKKVEIITTGSGVQDEIKKIYQKVFHKIGYSHIGFIPIKERTEASKTSYIKRVETAGAIFFTGGDQFRLSTILGGTPIVDTLLKKYHQESDFIVAGTSAGAMVMSSIMIMCGGLSEALIDRNLHTSAGLGFLADCIIDTHFIKRGRFGRLAHAVIMNPGKLGIGLGEDTALIIKNGDDAECRGSGMVVIIDGRHIHQTNIMDAVEGEPVYVENLKVHLLVKGCQFSINSRELANPAIPKKHRK